MIRPRQQTFLSWSENRVLHLRFPFQTFCWWFDRTSLRKNCELVVRLYGFSCVLRHNHSPCSQEGIEASLVSEMEGLEDRRLRWLHNRLSRLLIPHINQLLCRNFGRKKCNGLVHLSHAMLEAFREFYRQNHRQRRWTLLQHETVDAEHWRHGKPHRRKEVATLLRCSMERRS